MASTQTFDAKQMTIVPGFTDCHNHADGTTLLYAAWNRGTPNVRQRSLRPRLSGPSAG